MLLTAGLEAGQRARIVPFSRLASTKLLPGLLSLREVQEVGTIQLKELLCVKDNPIQSYPSKTTATAAVKDQRRDWLTLVARELLGVFFLFSQNNNPCGIAYRPNFSFFFFPSSAIKVDIKYITNTQIIEINYEGRRRRFIVRSITPKGSSRTNTTEPDDELSHDVSALSLDQPKQLWSVTWECTVSITFDDHTDKESASHKVNKKIKFYASHLLLSTHTHKPHLMTTDMCPPLLQPEIEMLAQRSIKDTFSSVGGLNKQIEEIRDLLEIPLTRPELFRYFGERRFFFFTLQSKKDKRLKGGLFNRA